MMEQVGIIFDLMSATISSTPDVLFLLRESQDLPPPPILHLMKWKSPVWFVVRKGRLAGAIGILV